MLLLPAERAQMFLCTGRLEGRSATPSCRLAMLKTPSLQSLRHEIRCKTGGQGAGGVEEPLPRLEGLKGSLHWLGFWVLISMRELNHYIKTSKH